MTLEHGSQLAQFEQIPNPWLRIGKVQKTLCSARGQIEADQRADAARNIHPLPCEIIVKIVRVLHTR